MSDSRIGQARALVDDARTLLADIAEEIDNNELEVARFSLNVSLRHLNVLDVSL